MNESCGNVGIQWLKLGSIGCALIEKHEYQDALQPSGGMLLQQDTESIAAKLRTSIPEMPIGSDSIDVVVSNISFQGDGENLRIAYRLESSDLMAENWWLRDYLSAETVLQIVGEYSIQY